MIKITILTLGKLKEKYLIEFAKKYIKLLNHYCKLEFIEIDSIKIKDDVNKILAIEEKKILKFIENRNNYIIVLDEIGKEFTSIEFSKKMEKIINYENKPLLFIIGSPYGLTKKIKDKANLKLALSKLTFTHDMSRIFLLEQIYRNFKIMKKESYHK